MALGGVLWAGDRVEAQHDNKKNLAKVNALLNKTPWKSLVQDSIYTDYNP